MAEPLKLACDISSLDSVTLSHDADPPGDAMLMIEGVTQDRTTVVYLSPERQRQLFRWLAAHLHETGEL